MNSKKLANLAIGALILAAHSPAESQAVSFDQEIPMHYLAAGCGANCASPLKQQAPGDGYYHPETAQPSKAPTAETVPSLPDTSGLSSYSGTSTGSGPNNGYSGTPKGSYHTNVNGNQKH